MSDCAQCGADLSDYSLVGYDGPGADGKPDPANEDCSLFMEWLTLCHSCFSAYES